MAGSDPKHNWQRKIRQLVDEQLSRSDFLKDADSVKDKPPIVQWLHLAPKYQLPLSSYSYVMGYLRTSKRDSNQISSPVVLVSEIDRTIEPSAVDPKLHYQVHEVSLHKFANNRRLYIEISEESTTTDIENFLRANGELIRAKMHLRETAPKQPIRQTYYAERDDRIYNAFTAKQPPKQIAEDEGLAAEYVRKIIARQKKKRDI